jgi:hypothetical protein
MTLLLVPLVFHQDYLLRIPRFTLAHSYFNASASFTACNINTLNMSSKPHLQIFNASRTTYCKELNFHHFPLLPKELRMKIWRHPLQRQRIIKVRLIAEKLFHPEQATTQETESTTPNRKVERYRAYVNGWQTLSKFMRANREAREAALEFYRVHLPCRLSYEETVIESVPPNGILYFNPEYDFLHISPVP